MTHMLLELYTPKEAWLALEPEARHAFLAKVGASMGPLLAHGIEPCGFGEIADDMPHGASSRFFAVWQAPSRTALDALVAGITASGWHEYFETINAAGQSCDLSAHLGQLMAA